MSLWWLIVAIGEACQVLTTYPIPCRPRTVPQASLEQHMATGRHAVVTGLLAETGPHASRRSSRHSAAWSKA